MQRNNADRYGELASWIFRIPNSGLILQRLSKNVGSFRFLLAGQLISRFVYAPLVQITVAHIGGKFRAGDALESVIAEYLQRIRPYAASETRAFRSEDALEEWLERLKGRSPVTVLLDSRGRQMSSEAFAAWLGVRRDDGAQHIVFAIGPASGWTDGARRRAGLLLSLGSMTLAHALARAVLAEQIYRAFTILSGHPYHTGH